ncbi:MAG: galactose-1-phosphate uridylyltransferase [Actinobacteria bacterium]|nr:galactose-1-phosphate uridylyltransferase [Actinomycetota bacterium]
MQDHGNARRNVDHHADGIGAQVLERRVHDLNLTGDKNDAVPEREPRVDPVLGTTVHIVGARQARPNLPDNRSTSDCPFCVGGLEAPEPYDTRWFVNRWPAMDGDRCEVILHSPEHDASFASLGVDGVARVIDLWAERTEALGARPDVDFVLVFENRGASIGATISHPHGQIYAYDHVPARSARLMGPNGWTPTADDRLAFAGNDTMVAAVPHAPVYPVAVTIAPRERVGRLAELDARGRRDLADMLADVLTRLDRLHDAAIPYMLWVNQRPFSSGFDDAWLNVEIVSPWRAANLPRYIAAAEVGAGEFFNPVVPEELAARLADLGD